MIVVDRISLNGKRYIAAEDRGSLEDFCRVTGIPEAWIRWSEKHKKHYLRLWGRYKNV